MTKRVTGLGGVFFKVKDRQVMTEWYKKHLGLDIEEWGGVMFQWADLPAINPDAYSMISFFDQNSDQVQPSSKDFMLNLVVDDLFALVEALKNEGIELIGEPSDTEFGKFASIMDPEGNKLELWEPAKAK
ncbi:MAG TPA: VOC family protein [Candidatus Saccharimonadales bacterium]|nr:VOC family protein [Candidatus Saccharimonadales bacterium]